MSGTTLTKGSPTSWTCICVEFGPRLTKRVRPDCWKPFAEPAIAFANRMLSGLVSRRLLWFSPIGELRGSIRLRLTLWYVALLAVVLIAFSVGIYIFLIAHISSEVGDV